MPSLQNVLAGSGYRDRRDQIEKQEAALQSNAINQAGALQRIYQTQETMRTGAADRATAEQDRQMLQSVMQQTGGNAELAIAALLKAGTPKSIELASKLKGLLPDKTKPELVTVVGPDGKPMQRWINPGDATGVDVGQKYEKPDSTSERWSDPYQMGGAWVQKNLDTSQIRQAVPRESQAAASPPAVTPVTIQDPNDPSGAGTVVMDARTRSIIGKGPKLTQTGTSEAKLIASKPQAKLRVDSMIQGIDRLSMAIAELDAMPGLTNITGTIMGRTPNITNAATSAQAKLDSIKSQIFQSSLQAMREASKTGGAVGNVSDREGDKLERTIAALDQAQGTPEFKSELKKARAQLALSKALIQRAYDEQFGGVQDTPQRRASDKGDAPRIVDW